MGSKRKVWVTDGFSARRLVIGPPPEFVRTCPANGSAKGPFTDDFYTETLRMKCFSLVRGAAVTLAALGMMIPNAPAMAAGPQRVTVKSVDAKIFDISLQQGGAFKGRVVDHTGASMEGAAISVKQNNKEVARTITDKDGSFEVANMKGGVYTVSSGSTEGTYRVWDAKVAPPSAKEQSLLVLGQNGARGQFGCCDPCTGVYIVGGIAVAALTVGIIALVKANDIPHSP